MILEQEHRKPTQESLFEHLKQAYHELVSAYTQASTHGHAQDNEIIAALAKVRTFADEMIRWGLL